MCFLFQSPRRRNLVLPLGEQSTDSRPCMQCLRTMDDLLMVVVEGKVGVFAWFRHLIRESCLLLDHQFQVRLRSGVRNLRVFIPSTS
ncbi:hypothetical protein TIFTF001_012963 [Ficus carica]|uniref:Uncharacterized protein n=1 Tax=Ficus carica TaxID=3494 RepID=A0AA88ADA7_FICCA|nr:hypothetical protein TIFTF001_012963 [Ficus carica]